MLAGAAAGHRRAASGTRPCVLQQAHQALQVNSHQCVVCLVLCLCMRVVYDVVSVHVFAFVCHVYDCIVVLGTVFVLFLFICYC